MHIILGSNICIIYIQWGTLILTGRHILLVSICCIIYIQYGPLLLTDMHLIHIRKSLVDEWTIFLWRVILDLLNLIITLGIITHIFQILWFIFLSVPFHLHEMYFYYTIIVKLFCGIFLPVPITLKIRFRLSFKDNPYF